MNDTELLTEMLGAVRELAERVERIEATVRENCNAAKILTSRRERHRVYMANLRSTTKDVNSQQCVISQKETEAEIRELPPTPPIENKGEEKENHDFYDNLRAHTHVYVAPMKATRRIEEEIYDIHTPPSLEAALHFGKLHKIRRSIVREWWNFENKYGHWLDKATHEPMSNWHIVLYGWKKNQPKIDGAKKRDKKNDKLRDARLESEAAKLKTEAARLETEKAKAEFYRDRRTANNQPKGVVLQQEDYNVKF